MVRNKNILRNILRRAMRQVIKEEVINKHLFLQTMFFYNKKFTNIHLRIK